MASIGASKHKYEEQMSIKPTFSATKEEQFDNKFSAQIAACIAFITHE